MAKVEDCPGFETFGEDVRAAREALGLTIKALAEQINIDPRYLSEIELKPTIPSIPVILPYNEMNFEIFKKLGKCRRIFQCPTTTTSEAGR